MRQQLILQEGLTEVTQKADEFQAETIHEGIEVKLVASFRYHIEEGPLGPGRHRREIKLAIHMDRKAAGDLVIALVKVLCAEEEVPELARWTTMPEGVTLEDIVMAADARRRSVMAALKTMDAP